MLIKTNHLIPLCLTIVVSMILIWYSPILIISAFAPSIAYLLYIWRKEKIEREPLLAVIITFSYGFILSTTIASILEIPITKFAKIIGIPMPVVTVIPVIEELAKFLGVYSVAQHRNLFNEIDDGIVYGASVGLGFSTLETVLYAFYSKNPLIVGLLRACCCTALHSASTAFCGWGYARYLLAGKSKAIFYASLTLAIILHAFHNFIAYLMEFRPSLIIFLIFIDITLFAFIISKVR